MSWFSELLEYLGGAPEPPSPDEREEFALRLKTLLQTLGHPVRMDMEEFSFVHQTDSQVSFLHNHYEAWSALPTEEREGGLIRAAESIVTLSAKTELPKAYDEAAPNLLVRMRPLAHLAALRIDMKVRGAEVELDLASLPVGAHLGAQLVFDTPATIIQFPRSQVVDWGVQLETCFERARKNLVALNPNPFIRVTDGVYASDEGDCYDSARILLTEQIASLPVQGRPIALPANRDTLLLTGEHDEQGLHILLEAAVAATKTPRLDTLRLLVLDDGEWSEWLPPPDHALHAEWVELAIRTTGSGYAEVRDKLGRLHEAQDEDVFIAKFGAMEIEGVLHSYAVWPPIPTLLPQADLIIMPVSEDPEEGFVHLRWHDVVALAGDLLERVPHLEPPFWQTTGHPTTDRLEALRAVDIPLSR